MLLMITCIVAGNEPAPDADGTAACKSLYVYNDYYLVISKSAFRVSLLRDSTLVGSFPCSVGEYPEDKQSEGDNRTPEGNFHVVSIENSTHWLHDFKGDGKGLVKGAYGPWFFRLYTGADSTNSGKTWTGIGIHGTHRPDLVGSNASEGCIRMRNADLLELKKYIRLGMPVRIEA